MIRLWQWIKSALAPAPHESPQAFDPSRDAAIRWFRRQAHESKKATQRINQLEAAYLHDKRRESQHE